MKLQKITAAILAATIMFGSLTTFGLAEENPTEDTPEQVQTLAANNTFIEGDLKFKELEDGTLSVSIIGEENRETITEAIIPNEINGKVVTKIGDGAFSGCINLTSVTIPNSIKEIGWYAFERCSSLTSITIPNGVTELNWTFTRCTNLISVTIPDSVTKIGECAFSGCASLASIRIPDNVTSIGTSAFITCTGLTSISIPSGIKGIGISAFTGCANLTSITIPDSVTWIGNAAFANCTSLADIYYEGDTEKWKKIIIEEFEYVADEIKNATIHYNCVPIDITDQATKINVTGIFSTKVDFSVKPIAELSNGTQYAYDLTFTDANGVEIQPKTEVTVKIPIPETFKDKELYVYHVLDGKNIPVDTVFENGAAIFTADHFSTFILSEKQLSETEVQPSKPEIVTPGATDKTSDTTNGTDKNSDKSNGTDQKGTGIALAIAPAVLACAAVAVASKKKK